MKVLVNGRSLREDGVFEAARLRKNLKGALEMAGIDRVDTPLSNFDIFHAITPDDESWATDAALSGKKVVVSALYAEQEPRSRFLEQDNEKRWRLRGKAARLLMVADAVIVPSVAAKEFLMARGVSKERITVMSAGVSTARFEGNDEIERTVFAKYFRMNGNEPCVVSSGSLKDEDAIARLAVLAKLFPSYRFFRFGPRINALLWRSKLAKINRKTPSNLLVSELVPDDVYRSALMNAVAYVHLDSQPMSSIAILETFASKTPLLVFGNGELPEPLKCGTNCQCPKTLDELQKVLASAVNGDDRKTVEAGFRIAKAQSIGEIGKKLKTLYQKVLGLKEEVE